MRVRAPHLPEKCVPGLAGVTWVATALQCRDRIMDSGSVLVLGGDAEQPVWVTGSRGRLWDALEEPWLRVCFCSLIVGLVAVLRAASCLTPVPEAWLL